MIRKLSISILAKVLLWSSGGQRECLAQHVEIWDHARQVSS